VDAADRALAPDVPDLGVMAEVERERSHVTPIGL
jgi:hypothetical protein